MMEEFETELRLSTIIHSILLITNIEQFVVLCQHRVPKHNVSKEPITNKQKHNCVMWLKNVEENCRCDNQCTYTRHEAVQRGRSTSIKHTLCLHYINNNTYNYNGETSRKSSFEQTNIFNIVNIDFFYFYFGEIRALFRFSEVSVNVRWTNDPRLPCD